MPVQPGRSLSLETTAPEGRLGRPRASTVPPIPTIIPETSSSDIRPGGAGRAGVRKDAGGENPKERVGRVAAKTDGAEPSGVNADIRTPVPPRSGDSASRPDAIESFEVAAITRACHRNETISKAVVRGREEQNSGARRLAEANILLTEDGSSRLHLSPGGRRDWPVEKNLGKPWNDPESTKAGVGSARAPNKTCPERKSKHAPVGGGVEEKAAASDDQALPDRHFMGFAEFENL